MVWKTTVTDKATVSDPHHLLRMMAPHSVQTSSSCHTFESFYGKGILGYYSSLRIKMVIGAGLTARKNPSTLNKLNTSYLHMCFQLFFPAVLVKKFLREKLYSFRSNCISVSISTFKNFIVLFLKLCTCFKVHL